MLRLMHSPSFSEDHNRKQPLKKCRLVRSKKKPRDFVCSLPELSSPLPTHPEPDMHLIADLEQEQTINPRPPSPSSVASLSLSLPHRIHVRSWTMAGRGRPIRVTGYGLSRRQLQLAAISIMGC